MGGEHIEFLKMCSPWVNLSMNLDNGDRDSQNVFPLVGGVFPLFPLKTY